MTVLAVNCALADIPVDPARLYDNEDPYFELWLDQVVDMVGEAQREAERAQNG